MLKIYAHKEHPDAIIPTVAYEGTSAAFDITSIKDITIFPHSKAIIPNGLNITIDQNDDYYMTISLRSSKGFKEDLMVFPGICDAGYTGDLGIKVYNMSNFPMYIKKGEKYAQITVHEKPKFEIIELNDEEFEILKNKQLRGDKGFGSSNK